jgi:hypothetical protein
MSTFDARPGTRGARQPSNRMVLWINGFVARRVRKGDDHRASRASISAGDSSTPPWHMPPHQAEAINVAGRLVLSA